MPPSDSIFSSLFWLSLAGVFYAYLIYPLLLHLLSHLFGTTPSPPRIDNASLPRVALLIAAHNEAPVIEQRLRNALALDYPADRLDIVIASDGSDDATADIVRRFAPRVRLLDFPTRRGKAVTLNAALAQLDAPVIALSDANTDMHPAAIRNLARWFSDSRIGVVCGRLVLTDPATGRNADGLYWRYETFLKLRESRLGALLGANGAIYALRRECFAPLPPAAIVDDFVIPLAARLRTGCRILYDPDAVAHEQSARDLRAEFHRRRRIGVGAVQSLALLWPLLSPRHGWTAFAFWSHKVARWLGPFFLIAAFAASLALAADPLYYTLLLVQVAFYTLCLGISFLPPASRIVRPLRIFPMFAAMNLAILTGFARWLFSRPTGIWTRTERSLPASS